MAGGVVLISKEVSNTNVYLVQRGMAMIVLSKCCDVELRTVGGGWFSCGGCAKQLHKPMTFTNNVDLSWYKGQFGPDDKMKQGNWGEWLQEWFDIEDGSIEMKW